MPVHWRRMCIAAVLGVACNAPQPASTSRGSTQRHVEPEARAPGPPPPSWQVAYDLDGDGTNDRIVSRFSGGAHCCYHIGATLSSTGDTVVLPFDMDGGYPFGPDLSQPDQFTVRTRDGGLPELVYQISTYNGEPQPLDPAWKQRWGISSHRIALCFADGKAQVRDDTPDLVPCTP